MIDNNKYLPYIILSYVVVYAFVVVSVCVLMELQHCGKPSACIQLICVIYTTLFINYGSLALPCVMLCLGHIGPHTDDNLLCQESALVLPPKTGRFPSGLVV